MKHYLEAHDSGIRSHLGLLGSLIFSPYQVQTSSMFYEVWKKDGPIKEKKGVPEECVYNEWGAKLLCP